MRPEEVEQIKVTEFLRQCTELPFIHIPNERRCSPQEGHKLKRMGVKKGVSDLFLPRKNAYASGLWIELKTENGRATTEQINFLKEMRLEGYEAEICYGANEAISQIKRFYSIE